MACRCVGLPREVTLRPMAVHSRPTVLLTRPRVASERFARDLHGVDIVIAPLMDIVSTGADIRLDGIAGVILTSEAAVATLPKAALTAYCVGPRTADAARAAGFAAEEIGPNATELVAQLLARRPRGNLLHVRGQHQRGDVAARLSAGGVPTREVVAYDQREVEPGPAFRSALARDGLLVPLFSPRSAAIFADAAGNLGPAVELFAMSAAVAEALPDGLRARCTTIGTPNGAEMARVLNAAAMRRISP